MTPSTVDAHRLTSDRRDDDDEPTFRPRCSCGWQSADWVDRATATELGDDHLAAANTTAPRLPKANAVTLVEPTPPSSRITRIAAGLRQLADWIDTNGELLTATDPYLDVIMHMSARTRPAMAAIARAGLDAGVKVDKSYGDQYASVTLHFGPHVRIDAYAARAEVCDRVVTGTREVVEEVPDPVLLAAVPKVTVTKTVEDVEYRCLPLLADVPGGVR